MVSVLEGGRQLAWMKEQTTFDTLLDFAATDAVSPLRGTLKLSPEYAHEDAKESVGTNSLQTELAQSKVGKWAGQFYVKPNAVGVAPDIGVLLKAALGVETVVGSTSVTYSLSDTVRTPLQILQNIADAYQVNASGAWVEELSAEIQKGSAPILSFGGGYATHGWAYADEVGAGGIAYNATSLPLDDDIRGALGVNGRIKFSTPSDDGGVAGVTAAGGAETYNLALGAGSKTLTLKVDGGSAQTVTLEEGDFVDDEAATAAEVAAVINADTTGCTAWSDSGTLKITSDTVGSASIIQVTGGTANAILAFDTNTHSGTAGTGYLVTATTDTTGAATATISPAVVSRAGHAAATAIVPWVPSQTVGGTKLTAGQCSLTIDGVSFGFVSAKLSVSTGHHGRDKEATSEKPVGIIGGARSVSLELQLYFLHGNPSNASISGRAWAQATHAVVLRVGPNTAAQKMTINIPSIRFDVVPIEIPEAEEAMLVLRGKARQNAAACDELTIVFD